MVTEQRGKYTYINGKPFPYRDGETILRFINRCLGRHAVPTLCQAPNLNPIGSCRLCSVELRNHQSGPTSVVASCHTPVMPGSYITTHSPNLQKLRKHILELILTDHPLDCQTCEADGKCELQRIAIKLDVSDTRYLPGKNHLQYKPDTSHPYMRSDLSKCINCYRCVAACDEVQGQFVLSMFGRGFDSRIIKDQDLDFNQSTCVACGACAQTCPTSAISDRYKFATSPATEKERTICTYCGVGCNLEVAVEGDQVLSIEAPYDAEVNQGHACLKGRYAFGFYNHRDRLKDPQLRDGNSFKAVSWDRAYQLIAEKLTEIKTQFGADAIAGISSSRCTNEENYLMQKFMRAVIGTNNIDGCARLCHAPTATGLQQTFGTGAATNSIKDLKKADCILVIGANPTTAHPVTGARIKQQAIKGKTLIVIDPRKTELARYADYHLQLRPGTNVAVLNLMLYYIFQNNWEDNEFLKARCEGYDDFQKRVLAIDVDHLEQVSGVSRELIKLAAQSYANADRAMSFHGLGVTEHSQGTYAVQLIADLAMVTGNIGRPGVGVNPLRGQNNVQGAADMGVQPNQGAGYLDVSDPEVRQHYEHWYQVPFPTNKGLTIPEMLDAALAGRLKALWIMGEHVLQTEPNTEKVKQALANLDLLIVQELFMTETAEMAHLVLPGASFLEKSGTFTNGERRIQQVNQVVSPIGNAKCDGQIMVEIMQYMNYDQPDYDHKQVLKEISQVVPFFQGVTWDSLGTNGIQWPVLENGVGTEILHVDSFKRGKGKLIFKDFEESKELLEHAGNYPFILTTNRALEHYNCGTMTRRTDLKDLLTEDQLLMNPIDADSMGIRDGEIIKVSSARGEIHIRVKKSPEVKPGILSTTFHFPEILVNKLMSDVCDSETICPEYKVVSVDVSKIEPVWKSQASHQ